MADEPSPALWVIAMGGRDPTVLEPGDWWRTFDGQSLEDLLRQSVVGLLKCFQDGGNSFFRWECLLDEVINDVPVISARKHDAVCLGNSSPGSTDLLVVVNNRARLVEVNDESQVRLVKTHA